MTSRSSQLALRKQLAKHRSSSVSGSPRLTRPSESSPHDSSLFLAAAASPPSPSPPHDATAINQPAPVVTMPDRRAVPRNPLMCVPPSASYHEARLRDVKP